MRTQVPRLILAAARRALKFSWGARPSLVAGKFRLQTIEKEHPIRAFVLCFDGSARLQFEQRLHVSGNSFRDVDLAGRAVRFHK